MALTLSAADRATLRDKLIAVAKDRENAKTTARSFDDTRWGELADIALDTVVEYAGPGTPLSAVRDAAVRLVAWLAMSSAVMEQNNVSGADGTGLVRQFCGGSAIRASGALPLLAPWRAVRAFEGV